MRTRYLTMMGAAVLAASVFGSGCSRKPDVSDTGSARIAAINLLAYSDIKKVDVTIAQDSSGANPAAIVKPILVPLGQKTNSNDWVSTVQGIPAGNVLYTGNAYDATGAVIFTGNIKGVVTASQTANVLINLFQATANKFSNNAPVITALQIATTSATPGQAVDVNVVATDADVGDTLTYAWTSTCGAVSPANVAHSTWTAPASSSAPCVLTVSVTDNHGAQTSATASISVSAINKGGAAITVAPDLAPVISAINVNVTNAANTAAAFVNGNIAHLQVVASDDGPALTYAWTVAGCTGAFADAALSATAFTLASDAPAICTFTVVVTDDKGQPTSGSLVLPVAPTAGSSAAAPIVETYSNSSDTMSPGQEIYFYVSVSQIAHDSITFAWVGDPGSAPGYSQTDSVDPNFATPSSAIKYVVPANLGDLAQPAVITVTATDSVSHLTVSHTWNLTKKTAQCAGGSTGTCDDGNACTTGDHCDGLGTCVPGTALDCTTNLPLCKAAGVCSPSSGQCVYPDAPSGTSCTDGLGCTSADICNGHGVCNGTPVQCPVAQCQTAGTCQEPSGTCSAPTPVTGGSCNDGVNCTTGDTCANGACVGTPVTCAVATDACHVAGTCQESTGICSVQTAGNEGAACNDNSPCTTGDVCQAGVCTGAALCQSPLICDASTTPVSCKAPACMQPAVAKDWNVATVALASDGGSAPSAYTTGSTFAAVDFGAGAIPYAGDTDLYVNKINMTTGLATWSKGFGDSAAQHGIGVAETTAASGGVVGLIGDYLGGVPGTGLPTNTGTVKVDFLVGLKASDGSVIWAKKVDQAGGGFMSISSNPTLGAFFVCGTTGTINTAAGAAAAADLASGLTANGGQDIVVAKINAADGTVAWAKVFGSTGAETCTAITSDDAGQNVYVTGVYSNDTAFAFPGMAALPAASSTQGKIYIAQLSGSTGTVLASGGFGGVSRNLPTSLAADISGNVYLGGGMFGTLDFGNSVSLTSAGNADAFIVKFNSGLTAQCGAKWGDSALQKVSALATDSAGHVFAGGLFQGSINIGTGGASIASAGNADAFTLSMDAQCNLKCGATYGDSAGQQVDAITVSRFATGAAQNTAMFSGVYASTLNVVTPALSTTNSSDGYIAAISTSALLSGL